MHTYSAGEVHRSIALSMPVPGRRRVRQSKGRTWDAKRMQILREKKTNSGFSKAKGLYLYKANGVTFVFFSLCLFFTSCFLSVKGNRSINEAISCFGVTIGDLDQFMWNLVNENIWQHIAVFTWKCKYSWRMIHPINKMVVSVITLFGIVEVHFALNCSNKCRCRLSWRWNQPCDSRVMGVQQGQRQGSDSQQRREEVRFWD